jgi:hypothetical protein
MWFPWERNFLASFIYITIATKNRTAFKIPKTGWQNYQNRVVLPRIPFIFAHFCFTSSFFLEMSYLWKIVTLIFKSYDAL